MSRVWYFAYDSIDRNRLESNKITIYDVHMGMLQGYSISHRSVSKNNSMMTAASLIQDSKSITNGTVFLVDESDMNKIQKLENKDVKKTPQILPVIIKKTKANVDAYVFMPDFDNNIIGDITSNAVGSLNKLFAPNRMKNTTKFMKWEKSAPITGPMMTFEEFRENF